MVSRQFISNQKINKSMAAKKKQIEGALESPEDAITELQSQLDTLQEQFDRVVAQRVQAISDRDTVSNMLDERVKLHTALGAGAKEALAALDYAIGKGLIRAGSPMDKAFDNLRAALKACAPPTE